MRYLGLKVNGVKKDLHRHIMEVHLGRKLDRYEVVHHKDENIYNNDITNLEVMTLSEHTSLHMKGKPGRVPSPEQIERVREKCIESCPNRQLSKEDIIEIRRLLANTTLSKVEIAKAYSVHKKTIYNIASGKRYAWVK